ncbi:winged helix DNA-binding domain-containing protein [SAR116 cluster bacterium]|nr:winged helix DNA-binding domain-containing protein [SAR116 cluster bacterium]
MEPLRINNRTARELWLESQGLAGSPTGKLDVLGMIKGLGFVQLDSIQVVSRAHHHILWSRNANYREPMLNKLLAKDRSIFEHFTHDASVIPMDFLPFWQRQFRRKKEQLDRSTWYKGLPDRRGREEIRQRISRDGPLSTHAFDTKIDPEIDPKITGPKEMWSRPPHKLALDYMWYTGELATAYRMNFNKYYDLEERIFPSEIRDICISDREQINWLCEAALNRMGFGLQGEVQHYWDAVSTRECAEWLTRAAAKIQRVEIESANGQWIKAIAPLDIEDRLAILGQATSRLRILNPFDPVIRDRNRLKRLFGFEYRVEMFVPAAKRVWGYYVFPILEGRRFVGRIEIKANRKNSVLNVINFWPEKECHWSQSRHKKLSSELERMRRFIGVKRIEWTA